MASGISEKKRSFRYFLKNRSSDYNQYGRYLVQDFGYRDLPLRFFGQLGDLVIMLLPVMIWVDLFLLVVSGVISINFLYATMLGTSILILIATVIANPYISILFKGQSFGKVGLRMKVVDFENKELDRNTIIIREALGKEIPIILLYVFLGLWGVLIFLVINGLCVVIDRKHRSIIDIVLKTKVVMLDAKGMRHKTLEKPEVKPAQKPQTENKIDLHLYSTFSHDGECEVEDLFKQAKEIGVKTISICDHNSAKANLIAKQLITLYNINYVEGINIDCDYKGHHVRLLGYFINSNDQRFTTIEYENLAKEKAISARRIQLFEEYTGLMVDSEVLLKRSRFQVVTPEAIARQVLTNVNYQKEKILAPYLYGNKKEYPILNFVEDFFEKGKVAYVPVVHPQLEDMIALVKATGGVCVLAHPMYSLKDTPEVIEEIIQLQIEGLEVFTPRHNLNEVKYLLTLAKKYKLDVSAGSEYHGENKPQFILGKTNCPKSAEPLVEQFIRKYQNTSK